MKSLAIFIGVLELMFLPAIFSCEHSRVAEKVLDEPCAFHEKYPNVNRPEDLLFNMCAEGNAIACDILENDGQNNTGR